MSKSKEDQVKWGGRTKFWRVVRWAIGLFIVLLLVGYVAITSEAFLKKVILPQVGAALNSDITISEAEIHPFSAVALLNLQLKPHGEESLLIAKNVEAHYSLWSILRGNILVDSVVIDTPTITVVEDAKGVRNFDAMFSKKTSAAPAKKPAPDKPASPLKVDIRLVTLKNATLRYTKTPKGGGVSVTEIANGNIKLSNLQNGGTAKLEVSGWLSTKNTTPGNAGNLNATFVANYSCGLTSDLNPGSVNGKSTFTVTKVDGIFSELASLAASLDCDVSPTQVKQLALRFTQSGQPLGEISVAGPFDAAKHEGKLTMGINSIDRRVLNLFGANAGFDFGTTAINAVNEVELTKGGNLISVNGKLNVARFQVKKQNQTTPTLTLLCTYNTTIDSAGKSAVLKTFDLAGSQDSRPLLEGKLTSPMTIAFGDTNAAGSDAALSLSVINLSLADWRLFAPDLALEGMANARLKVLSQNGGNILLDVDSRIAGLNAQLNGNAISGLRAQLTGQVTSKQGQAFTGSLALTDLNGKFATYQFANYGVFTEFDVAKKNTQVDIRKLTGEVRETATSGGKFDVTGNFDTATKAGKISANLVDLNQTALRPFLESTLGDKKLVSISINSTTTASFEANGDLAVKTDSKLANLVVQDPKGAIPATPLEARFQVDAGVAKQVATIRQGELTLTPTDRAKNVLSLSGTVDMTKTNALTGNLKLAAESLDVTRYYDIFGDKPKPAVADTGKGKPAPAPAPTTPPAPQKEPDAVKLPFKNFAGEVAIGKFYLREVEMTDLKTVANVDGGHVLLKPLQMTLNGAPVKTELDLDMGVVGYKYDLTFSAQAVPVAPFVNSFQPERKGQMAGTFTAGAQIKGAGITGAGLQKNLTGNFNMLATNINLSVDNVRNPIITTILNVVIGIPELMKNPGGTALSYVGSLTGLGAKKEGWLDEISGAPINTIALTGTAGNGVVKLQETTVRSSAFLTEINGGDITLAPVLDDSKLNLPVRVSLGRSLANRISLSDSATPADAPYVPMPNFLTVDGTKAKPHAKLDKIVLTEMVAKGLVKSVPLLGGTVGKILNVGENILGGNKGTNSFGTNQPSATATNAPASDPVGSVLRGVGSLLGGKKEKDKTTNAPPK